MAKQPIRKSVSFRLRADIIAQLREFVRDHAGKPLYLEIGTFVEEAIIRHLNFTDKRLESGGVDSNSRFGVRSVHRNTPTSEA